MIRKPRFAEQSTPTRDSFVNPQMRLGNSTDSAGNPLNNLSNGGYYLNAVTRLRVTLDFAYRGSWIVRRAVDTVAEDMTREGIDFESSLDPKIHEDVENMMTDLSIWDSIQKTIKWSRLYGGCLAFIMIDGQDPATPLDVETVGKGTFRGLFVIDRWMCTPSLQDPITDMGPSIGLPKYYNVNTDANGIPMLRIHYSRVMRVVGDELPYYQRQAENMWSASILEALWDRLIAYDSVTMGAAQLVFKAHLRVYKLPNFRELVAEGGPMLAVVAQQLDTIRMFQSMEGLTVIDKEDEMEFNTYTFSGLSDLMLQFAQQVAGSVDIPMTRMFAQSPAGLNSSGDSDLRNYYDKNRSLQESKLRPGLKTLIPVMIRSLTGKNPPPGWRFTFKPLWQLNDSDKSTQSKTDTDDVASILDTGIISPQTALKELRERGRVTGRWQSITDEEIEDADDELPPKPDMSQFGAQPGEGGETPSSTQTDPATAKPLTTQQPTPKQAEQGESGGSKGMPKTKKIVKES